ncbi:glutamyl aminopeptidase-like isoform X2 [Tubulanus polymorphus]|uniref:glutamyl aminopeptidase-like isoform X2 n=1 Tax=Tubulanus polymorphus TaxID=672921 RepID=UPI003DA3D581
MSDNEIEEVSFLSDESQPLRNRQGQAGKRSHYEPKPVERCKQVVCSQGRAALIAVVVGLVIVIVALIAALARSPSPCAVANTNKNINLQTNSSKRMDTSSVKYPWNKILLPSTIVPLSYEIRMHPDLTAFTFRGEESINVRVVEETDWIIFHVDKLNVTKREVMSAMHRPIAIVKTLENEKNQQYMIQVERQLRKNEVLTINLEFDAKLSTGMSGFYLSSYETEKGEKRYLATTHFEPTDARAAFPCFDEPSLKATFKLSMVRDKKHIALFNMPKSSTEPYKRDTTGSATAAADLEVDHFETSEKMSTYLVAFVVCDYAHLTTTTKSNVKVSVYTPPHLIEQGRFALEAAAKVLDHYDEYFGIKYPLPKQDLIAIPDFAAGAMENWGLITYRMTTILWDPKQSSAHDQQYVAVVIAHELAHQWFGNLVTMKWWNDLWLNEGFASFVEFIGADIVNKAWHMFDQFVIDNNLPAMNLDSLSNSHPISVPVHNPSQINEIFDTISYDKGASIIRMLDGFLGKGIMQKGLKSYLHQHQFGNAETKDLWEALTEAVNGAVNVSEVMDTWTLQMGYPVVNLKRNAAKIEATQEYFLLNPNAERSKEFKSPFEYTWHVPLTYSTDQKPADSALVWLKRGPASFEIPANAKWIKANKNTIGFYRVNYDAATWQALIEQLRSDYTVFSAADRAGLIDDSFSLARAGQLDQVTALNLTHYLLQEEEYVPWDSALRSLLYLNRVLADLPDGYDLYKKYMLNLMSRIMGQVGWYDAPRDKPDNLKIYLRSLLLSIAIKLDHKPSIKKGKELFEGWKTQGTVLDPNLKDVVYHAGIVGGDEDNWNYCWEQYNKTQVPSEKSKLLYALAATKDGILLNKYLQFSLDQTKIRPQDTVSVIISVANNRVGKYLAWRFVQQNWDLLVSRYGEGSFDMTKLILRTPAHFTTQFDHDEVQHFFATVKTGSGARAVHQVLETIQMNVDWLKKYKDDVIEWLRRTT